MAETEALRNVLGHTLNELIAHCERKGMEIEESIVFIANTLDQKSTRDLMHREFAFLTGLN